jgi:hypothetical protein
VSAGPDRQPPGFRAPQNCPVCSERLHITRLGCEHCGTGLTGSFRPCSFCGLSDDDLALLRVFLVSRGTMKEVERHLGVSYPTARVRFDDLLRKLGLAPTVPAADDPTLAALRDLAAGRADVQATRDALRQNSSS